MAEVPELGGRCVDLDGGLGSGSDAQKKGDWEASCVWRADMIDSCSKGMMTVQGEAQDSI
jgi:hypothetical protein